ncbi:MAG: putative deoxyribonuclease YcfH [Firmicutes bacterium ADurb.Bin193]|nr:MAG: putative deoxyribonuclease YcfH [Firmicutes bacterium ADurb.Bin193]
MKALLFDSHAHYDDRRYDSDRAQVIKKIKESGVGGVVNIGSDMASSKRSVALAREYDFIYASVGVHPHETKGMKDSDLADLERWTKEPKVVAIGEIGLDYYYDNSPRDTQKYWFKKQLALAERLDFPVVIHTRNAIEDTLKILKESSARGIVHCFSESAEIAKRVVDMGFYIAFGGTLTYKNARHAVEAAKATPLSHILIETDCPYLAPEGHRGERNDSSLMRLVCERLAEIKGISFDEAAEATYQNARKVYRIDNKL